MTTSPIVVGVDVAKDRLDVAVRPRGEQWSEANDEAGVRALVARLRPLRPTLIVCEATGVLSEPRSRRSPPRGRPPRADDRRELGCVCPAVPPLWPARADPHR